MTRRRLLVDVSGTKLIGALPVSGRERLLAATPDGWETIVVDDANPLPMEWRRGASEEAKREAPLAEVYFGFGVQPDLVERAPLLRWVHSAASGVGKAITPALVERDIVLTNSSGTMGETIAEYVVAGLLHFLRGFDIAFRQRATHTWDQRPFMTAPAAVREISECHVVVIGTGGIGSAVARRVSKLGGTCTGVRRRSALDRPEGFDSVVSLDDLERVLPTADAVVLAVPLTPLTRNVMSSERLNCLPSRAIVVNVGRGALLDEGALAGRLESGQIRGAVLDVFQQEPLPTDSPLWEHPGVLVTPHVAAVSPRLFWERTIALFLDNWERYRSGASLRNVVDKDAGY